MNTNPLISIITVVFNGAATIEQTIQSVLHQTYRNIEYIIIDGGSTDGTLKIIKKYEKKIAFWKSEPDKGLYDAMNKGIAIASGELIGMINSDDWYEPNAVDLVVNAFISYPEKRIFHGDMYVVNKTNDKRLYKHNPSTFKFKYYGATFNHPTFFVTQQEYKEHHYNKDLKSQADIQFTMEAFLKDKSKFFYINSAISNFRLDGKSGNMKRIDSLKEGFVARKKAGMSHLENILSVCIRCIYWIICDVMFLTKKK